ncbi:MAG TPA: class D sortase [Candidatus Angelobacter sp.]|jgi:sortase A
MSLTQAWLYQKWARQQIESQVSHSVASDGGSAAKLKISYSSSLSQMEPIGRLEIPQIHISAVVAEGTSPLVLSRAVGHAVGTALPGQAGNVTLAAHCDTFFRHLGDVRSGDIIQVDEAKHAYKYQVRFTTVVGTKDTWVLQPTEKETLTLLTCYPFHFSRASPRPVHYSSAQDLCGRRMTLHTSKCHKHFRLPSKLRQSLWTIS